MEGHDYVNSQKTVYVLKRNKKRKISNAQLQIEEEAQPLPKNANNPLVRLLGGKEPLPFVKLRYENYKRSIQKQQDITSSLYQNLNVDLLKKIVEVAKSGESSDSTIQAIALFNKSSVGNGDSFIKKLIVKLESKRHTIVTLNSKESNTMRSALRNIIQGVTHEKSTLGKKQSNEGSDQEEKENEQLMFDKRSLYDLDIIREWSLKNYHKKNKIIVIFEDVDSFSPQLLGKLIKLMHSQNKKVHFRLIFNSSVNFTTFVRNIDVQVQNLLNFSSFEIDQVNHLINRVVEKLILTDDILIGEQLSQLITQKFHNSIKSIDVFDRILKFSKMAFHFNNPFSIFYDQEIDLPKDYAFALRQLPSFQRYIETLIGRSHYERAQILLTNDDKLKYFFSQEVTAFKENTRKFKSIFKFVTAVLLKFNPSSRDKDYNHLDIYHLLILNDDDNDHLKTEFFVDLINALRQMSFYEWTTLIKSIKSFGDGLVHDFYLTNKSMFSLNELNRLNEEQTTEAILQFKIEFTRFKDSFIKTLDLFLRKSYKPFPHLTFHEAFQISNSQNIVQKNLFPEFREDIINSLISHEAYLKSSITSPLQKFNELNNLVNPLIVELFQIYRNTSLILNIYDFYQVFKYSLNYNKIIDTFIEVLDDDTFNILENYLNDEERFKFIYQFFNDPSRSKEEKYNKLMLVFFLQKCNEMIYMGFFKERKPKDYLEKTVWRGL